MAIAKTHVCSFRGSYSVRVSGTQRFFFDLVRALDYCEAKKGRLYSWNGVKYERVAM